METIINERVLELIAGKAQLPVDELDFGQTLDEIGLDSLHLMETAVWMQREYGVVIPEGGLHHDQTLQEALAYLGAKIH